MAAACNLTFCVVGRDARQLAAARALQSSGYTVLGAEGAGQADYILLPMPMDAEAADLARILRAARPGTLALASANRCAKRRRPPGWSWWITFCGRSWPA